MSDQQTTDIMRDMQRKCLDALASVTRSGGEWCASFQRIQDATELSRTHVKRSIRALARKGLAEFHKGLCNEDGEFTGAGYCISAAGRGMAGAPDDAAEEPSAQAAPGQQAPLRYVAHRPELTLGHAGISSTAGP